MSSWMHEESIQTKHILSDRDVCHCKAYVMYKKYTIQHVVMCQLFLMKVMIEFPFLELSHFWRINASPE